MTRAQPPNGHQNGRQSAPLGHPSSTNPDLPARANQANGRASSPPEIADVQGVDPNGHPPSPQPKKLPPRRKRLLLAALGVGAAVAGIFGLRWWQYTSTHEQTDDAYVASHIHPVSSRIEGTVRQVLVNDNQQVQQGQVLVRLDPRDYENQLQQAQAALAKAQQQAATANSQIALASQTARGTTTEAQGNISSAAAAITTAQAAVTEAQAGVPVARSQVTAAEANLQRAQADYNRYQRLVRQGAVSAQQFESARNAYQVALAQRNSAQEQVTQAQARLARAQQDVAGAQAQLTASQGGLQRAQAGQVQTEVNRNQYQAALAAVSQAQAQLKNAQLQLSYTTIAAPTAGLIGNRNVEVGQRIQPGTPLLAVVDGQNWVVANFKETQLREMQPGEPAEINLDAFPNHPFTGHVESFSPATGSQFSLLPPDNATGNFTKVVQRVPIKVVFDSQSVQGYESQITPGMSAVVSVDVK